MTGLRHLVTVALAAIVLPAFGVTPSQEPPVQREPPGPLADLKSFFHGDPPPLVKAPPPAALAIVSSLPGTTPDTQVESFMRTLANALMARDGEMVVPRLSKQYAIDGMPDNAKASDFMIQAIAKMPGPTQIVIRTVEARGGIRIAKADFHYGPDKVSLKTFRFDASGNLLSCDLFSLARV
jgi:hypothetical protein